MTWFIDFIVSTVWPGALALILKVPVTCVALIVGLWQARSCLKSLGKVSTSDLFKPENLWPLAKLYRRRYDQTVKFVVSRWFASPNFRT